MAENVHMVKMLLQCEHVQVNGVEQDDNKKTSSLSVALATGNKQIIALLKDAGAISHPDNASSSSTVTFDWNLDVVHGGSGGSSSSNSSSSGKK